ncbi:hypothetical protein Tco_0495495, partial [Tanacetum coccineum]
GDDGVKLGRKGLNPKVEEVIEVNDDRSEESDREENRNDDVASSEVVDDS